MHRFSISAMVVSLAAIFLTYLVTTTYREAGASTVAPPAQTCTAAECPDAT